MKLDEAQIVLMTARDWFRAGTKSGNKRYKTPAELRQAVVDGTLAADDLDYMIQKSDRRNTNAAVAWPYNLKNSHASCEAVGDIMVQLDIRYGNCFEMTCLTAHLARVLHPGTQMFSVDVLAPADHMFLSVNDKPSGKSIRMMSGSAILIDTWMNICCYANDYYSEAQKKLEKWSARSKLVLVPGGNNQTTSLVDPNSIGFKGPLFDSVILSTRTNAAYGSVDPQSVMPA